MRNFNSPHSDPAFMSIMDVTMAAEKILLIVPAESILNCCRVQA